MLVVIAWFIITGVFGPLFGKLTSVQENNNSSFLPKGAEATLAADQIKSFSSQDSFNFPTLVLFEGTFTPATLAVVSAHVTKVGDLTLADTTAKISDYFAPSQVITVFPAADGKALLAIVPLDGNAISKLLPNDEPVLPAVIEALREDIRPIAQANGFTPYVTGPGGLLGDLFGAFGSLDSTLLLTTLAVVAVILIFVYRSPVLWIIPLLSSLFALSTAGGIIYLLAKNDIIDVDGQSQGILSVLVIGAATDYALLLIARYREELHFTDNRFVAMRAAYKGVWEPILASGSTVAISLLILLFSQLTNTASLGPIGAIGIVVSMITILTLLPALLLIFGRWIFWPRIPENDGDDHVLSGLWAKVANSIGRNPRKAWVITGVVLLAFAATSTTLKADGLGTVDSFTGNPESVVGQKLLETHFPGGEGDPTQVVIDVNKIAAVTGAIKSAPGVTDVTPMLDGMVISGQPKPEIKIVNGRAILNVTLNKAPDSVEAGNDIPKIRELAKGADSTALVGGTSAVYFDVRTANNRDNKTIIPIILLVITLILGLLLRSIFSAVVLLGTVVLSYFATLGVCALVFNHIFGFAGGDNSFPLFAFIFLVALGIDYNIFLMTRVREESTKIGTRAGVIKGVTVTGAVITSAGIVLAATFAVLGLLPLVPLAQLGFAVAFGVLLDTIIVRSILVPALVHEIGPKIWWPSKLQNK
ncbi:MAG: MMPL family transporter [Actinobacteria bacterium]|nr:MMPL family transporter [Actinomycetota bacterium]MSV70853.1 MMPL family transporter [Actinomycetota bacterium]MSW13484.1 MMPL family transporter [Actinomycetota bacterium]MSX47204.1 MMPL family transporter [Actinomycetota bacterium]MSX91115.1 MMPL family transporter [Actinomycetota bacterium]